MLDVAASTSMNHGQQYLGQTITMYFLLVTVVILVTRVWVSSSTKSKTKSMASKPRALPGPWGIPVFGNMLSLGRSAIHLTLMSLAEKFGPIFQIRLGSRPVLVLNGYDAIHKALVKQSVVFAGRPDLFTFGMINKMNESGSSLSFSDYDDSWKVHRKLAESSLRHFTAGNQVEFVESVVTTEATELAKHLKQIMPDCNNNGGNNTRDVRMILRLAVSNILCWFVFSKRHSYDNETLLNILAISDRFSAATASGNPVDFMPWLRVFMSKTTEDFREMLTEFRTFLSERLLNKHSEEYNDGSERDILDHLVTSGRRYNDDTTKVGISETRLLETSIDYFGAGFETVSATLEWCLLYMAAHPYIQTEIQKEIDTVVDDDRLPTLKDRDKLPLTQSCLLEILRHATPVVFAIPHSTTDDTVLDGYFVPKDTVVFVNLYSAHRDRNVWRDPEVFDARRFLNTDGSIDQEMKKHVIAFSVGRRRCIGSDLARIELFLFFVIFLKQFSIEHSKDGEVSLEPQEGLASRPKELNINLIPRN